MEISGIHHITAICGDPQQNIDFYARFMGLRTVKVTVNYDDPATYHFYFGNETGAPGSVLTFFPWPREYRGRSGSGQATAVAFSVPPGSTEYWHERAVGHEIHTEPFARLNDRGLRLFDPDGLLIELVEFTDKRAPWKGGDVPEEHAITGFHSATLAVGRRSHSAELLNRMGFREGFSNAQISRMEIGQAGAGQIVDLLDSNHRSATGVGTIHHIAFATPNDETQTVCTQELQTIGLQPTPVQDRQYFHSIYFREPSGILFEIATENPGFTADEAIEKLGSSLRLPAWLEPDRDAIAKLLKPIVTETGVHIP